MTVEPNIGQHDWKYRPNPIDPYKVWPGTKPWTPHDSYPTPHIPWEDIYKKPAPIPAKPKFPMSPEDIEKMEKLIRDSKDANEALKKQKEEDDLKTLQELADRFGYELVKKPVKSKKSKK